MSREIICTDVCVPVYILILVFLFKGVNIAVIMKILAKAPPEKEASA